MRNVERRWIAESMEGGIKMQNKIFINVLLSLDKPLDEDDSELLIKQDLECEIGSCWHFFNIEDIRQITETTKILTIRDIIKLSDVKKEAE